MLRLDLLIAVLPSQGLGLLYQFLRFYGELV
jgi:hypothetical protein